MMIVAKGVGVISGTPGGVMICWMPGVMYGIGGCFVANGGGGCTSDSAGLAGSPARDGVAPGVAQAGGEAIAFAGAGNGTRIVHEPDAHVAVIS